MPEMTPGERHRAIREAANLTRADLAARSGVGHRTIARFELENRLPRVGALRSLAGALGTTVGELLGEDRAA
jgi:transcriptional regulator with XRE-family HTH domain